MRVYNLERPDAARQSDGKGGSIATGGISYISCEICAPLATKALHIYAVADAIKSARRRRLRRPFPPRALTKTVRRRAYGATCI